MRSLLPSIALSTICLTTAARDSLADDAASARFRLDPVQPASALSPFFVVEGFLPPAVSPKDRLAIALTTTYSRSPLTVHVRQDGHDEVLATPVQHAVLAHVDAALRLNEHLSVDAEVPLVISQSGRDAVWGSSHIDAPHGAAAGDVRLGGAWRGWVTKHAGWIAAVRAWAPTGSADAYASDGRFRAELVGGTALRVDAVQGACMASISPTFSFSPRAGDRASVSCAAQWRTLRSGPWAGVEVTASALRASRDLPTGSEVEPWLTAHQPAGPFRLGLGFGPGLGSSPGTPVYRALVTFAWAPSPEPQPPAPSPAAPLDPDMDGVIGTSDACPDEAGPTADDPRRNGCPRKDSDGDGIDDWSDECPETPGIASDVPGSNGCTDRDSDHVADRLDACPDEPGRPSEDPSVSGCPRRARLRGDRFDLTPPLTAASETPDRQADDDTLWEIAFALRSAPHIAKVAVEVRLQAPDDEVDAVADRAIEIANDIVQRLVDLGVDRQRLEPVGVIADTPGVVIHVVDTGHATPPP